MDFYEQERATKFIAAARALIHANRGKRNHAPYDPDITMLGQEIRAIQLALDYLQEPSKERVQLLRAYAKAHRRIANAFADFATRDEGQLTQLLPHQTGGRS